VSNAKADLLDASLTVDGSLESPDKAPLSLDATGSGAIGAKMTEWISRQIDWPKQLMLRSPLQVSKGRVIWQDGGDVAFQGSLTVAGGPQLSVDLVQGFQTFEAKQITITDGRQNARMTLDLKKDYCDFSFNGSLDNQPLNEISKVPPREGSRIQGDIQVGVFWEARTRFTARGRRAGRDLRVPLKDQPAVVEFFFLEADQGGLNVRSADL